MLKELRTFCSRLDEGPRPSIIFLDPPDLLQAVFYHLDKDIHKVPAVREALITALLQPKDADIDPKQNIAAQLNLIMRTLLASYDEDNPLSLQLKLELAFKNLQQIARDFQIPIPPYLLQRNISPFPGTILENFRDFEDNVKMAISEAGYKYLPAAAEAATPLMFVDDFVDGGGLSNLSLAGSSAAAPYPWLGLVIPPAVASCSWLAEYEDTSRPASPSDDFREVSHQEELFEQLHNLVNGSLPFLEITPDNIWLDVCTLLLQHHDLANSSRGPIIREIVAAINQPDSTCTNLNTSWFYEQIKKDVNDTVRIVILNKFWENLEQKRSSSSPTLLQALGQLGEDDFSDINSLQMDLRARISNVAGTDIRLLYVLSMYRIEDNNFLTLLQRSQPLIEIQLAPRPKEAFEALQGKIRTVTGDAGTEDSRKLTVVKTNVDTKLEVLLSLDPIKNSDLRVIKNGGNNLSVKMENTFLYYYRLLINCFKAAIPQVEAYSSIHTTLKALDNEVFKFEWNKPFFLTTPDGQSISEGTAKWLDKMDQLLQECGDLIRECNIPLTRSVVLVSETGLDILPPSAPRAAAAPPAAAPAPVAAPPALGLGW